MLDSHILFFPKNYFMKNNIEILVPNFRRKAFGLTFVLSAAVMAFAQEQATAKTGTVKNADGAAVPYASVVYTNKANRNLSDAALTDENGNYTLQLAPGTYDITVEAVDFKKYTASQQIGGGALPAIVLVSEGAPKQEPSADNSTKIEEVVVTATAKPYKVELDKKTYDPSQDIISKGGNLQDVLTNVPSVSVDTDGTVSMRGNSNVRFLVNGKPSALLGIDDGANALRSIPADQIERIEVITNPSSKFEAAGTAGILNIILKKDRKLGFNGSVTGSLGYLPQTMLNTNLSWRKGNLTWFINGGGSYRESKSKMINTSTFKNITDPAAIVYSDQNGVTKNRQNSYNGSTGIVYDFDDRTSMNASVTVRSFDSDNSGNTDIIENLLNGTYSKRLQKQTGTSSNKAFQADLGLDKKLDADGQNLSASVSFQKNKTDSDTGTFEQGLSSIAYDNNFNQLTDNQTIIGKLDYEKPIGESSRIEAGYRIDVNQNKYDNTLSDFTAAQVQQNIVNLFTSNTDYKEMFNAFYLQFRSKVGNFAYQLGLRDEISKIDIDYVNRAGTGLVGSKNYNNLFPSVFLSYDLAKNNQFLLNYSRRIDRPRSFFLVPYGRYSGPRSLFAGNIDLNPSYIDSFEFGYNYTKGKWTLNPTLYYRHTTDDVKMLSYRPDERVNSISTMPINLGNDDRYGLDFNFTADVVKWLKLMGNVNLFGYKTTGLYTFTSINSNGVATTGSRDFSGSGFSSMARLTASVRVDRTFSLQFQGFYRGGQKTVSSDRGAMYALNFGLSKTVLEGNGTLAFNIQDIFNTRAMKARAFSNDLDTYSYMQWQPRQFNLTFTYRFKQGAKVELPKKRQEGTRSDDGQDMPPM